MRLWHIHMVVVALTLTALPACTRARLHTTHQRLALQQWPLARTEAAGLEGR